jgi:pilus assembly protein CpaF
MGICDIPNPLSIFLNDPDVSEIMVNGPELVFFEKGGRITRAEKRFADEADLLRVVRHILANVGKTISPQTPLFDVRLGDGSRFTLTMPPITPKTSFTIRRSTARIRILGELIKRGALSIEIASYLKQAVVAKRNILIAGGTSCGKTTLLNALASEIPSDNRIVTLEDTNEIVLPHLNWVPMETMIAQNPEQNVGMRALVSHALHLRPDRILLGECRGGEALDILQAMNSGHDGSMATIHASSPADVISRLETLVLMAGYELPLLAIRQQISRAIHVIVQMHRTAEGQRRITAVTEVAGFKDGQIVLKDIFVQAGDVVGQPLSAAGVVQEVYHRPEGAARPAPGVLSEQPHS